MNKLIIMCGVIGSGKTTWIKNYLKENPDTLVVSKDDIRRMLHGGKYVYDEKLEIRVQFILDDIIGELSCLDKDIIVDECHLTKGDRILVQMGMEDHSVTIIYFPPKHKEYHVNRRMNNSYGVSREVWESVYDRMIEDLEPPTEDECDELITVRY